VVNSYGYGASWVTYRETDCCRSSDLAHYNCTLDARLLVALGTFVPVVKGQAPHSWVALGRQLPDSNHAMVPEAAESSHAAGSSTALALPPHVPCRWRFAFQRPWLFHRCPDSRMGMARRETCMPTFVRACASRAGFRPRLGPSVLLDARVCGGFFPMGEVR
jgi:hypothetical protein